jgi:hypothetical protein
MQVIGTRSMIGADPDHPGLPARVSVETFPARGMVIRLLEPRDLSAVCSMDEPSSRVRRLRPVRWPGVRWSVMLGTP